jgi:MFS family permease
MLGVDFALYLHALQWRGTAIGLVLSSAGLCGAALSLGIGVSSDRLRRKPFLLWYEVILLLCSVAALLSADPLILTSAAILGGFGRGANGAAGPFSPAEQAWLAEEVASERRGQVYSLNAALGFFGMGLGAILATLPSFWSGWLEGALAYRPLFLLVGMTAVANIVILVHARERHRTSASDVQSQRQRRRSELRHAENWFLRKLVLINACNGLAIGLTGPLIAYWFARRFHVGPAAIAPVMAATFVLTGVSALLTGSLTERIGLVQSVVWERLVGLVLLVLLPLVPSYRFASVVYLFRSAVNRGSAGVQQALVVGSVGDERRGLATSVNAVSFQLPQSLGPSLAGYLLESGRLFLPFYLAAVLQGLYLAAYWSVFHNAPDELAFSRPTEHSPEASLDGERAKH